MFVGWFYMITSGRVTSQRTNARMEEMWKVPFSGDALYAMAFAAFALMTFILFASLGNSLSLMFKSPDVDVLFPTPVSPKKLLALRVLRDTITSTLVPLLIYAFMFRQAANEMIASFQRGTPGVQNLSLLTPMGVLAWISLSFTFTTASYATSLLFSRGTDEADRAGRNARILGLLCVLGAMGFVAVTMYTKGLSAVPASTQHPVVAILMFPATLASWIATAPLTGKWQLAAAGMGGLALLSVGLYSIALKNIHWLYDISTTSTTKFAVQMEAAKSQDMVAQAASRARQGKMRVRDTGIYRWSPRGPLALVWKEAIVFGRTQKWAWASLAITAVGLCVLIARVPLSKGDGPRDILLLFIAGSMVFTAAVTFGQTGFLQMLRLGDIQKPLPFGSGQVVFYEMLGKSIPPSLMSPLMGLGIVISRPQLGNIAASITILGSALTLVMMAVMAVVILLFPEHEDPTQRGIRGLLMMLGISVCTAPPVSAYIGLAFFAKVPHVLAALLPSALCVAIAVICTSVAGKLYASFNPSD